MSSLETLAPNSAAEEKFLDECSTPSRIIVGDGDLPDSAEPDCTIRAELIRAVLMGEGPELHDKGLRLRGAWIEEEIDLQGSSLTKDVTLTNCRVKGGLNLVGGAMSGLFLSGTEIGTISADNARFDGSVYIRNGTTVRGEIVLAGARIAGDFQVCDVHIHPPQQDAIFAPSLRVEGSVFLGNYPYAGSSTSLIAEGTLFFSSARIEHDCFVTNTAVSLNREANIVGIFEATEEHGRDVALSLSRAQVGGILYLKDNQIGSGLVNLAGASVARLSDEPAGPGANYPIRLDGFRYTDFSRHSEVDLKARLEWLERRPEDTPFTAQPYEQLATVLLGIGHRKDAHTVLMRKEQMIRAEARSEMTSPGRLGLAWITDKLLKWVIGYGYRPGRAVVFGVVLIVAMGLFFTATWRAGDMTPNAAPILVSQDWIAATESHPDNPAEFWSQPGQAGQDWETFNGFAYAADLLIPIVALGQESAWAPSTSRSPLGQIGWGLRWLAKGIGWVVTALGAAAVTGVIRRE